MKTTISTTREECVLAICQFARQYQAKRERTAQQLYENTGYHAYFEKVTQKEIEITVKQNSTFIDDWIRFTEDKRWTPAWGLAKRKKVLGAFFTFSKVELKTTRFCLKIQFQRAR
ncbi:MAG: hypothetical protein PHY43_05665 [Verrucomicrobiales bacterium]|nr:hypothetical protein [Verrucomicrobiales bacterium]